MEVRDLYYVGVPSEQQRLALKRGKELLGVDWLVQPREAVPGCPGPALAFEEPTFYIPKYALLTPPFTPARMAAALEELYDMTPGDHLNSGDDLLSKWLGAPVVFIEEVEL